MNRRIVSSVFLSPHSILTAFLVVAVILTAVMSLTSEFDRHPDERHHFEAAKYYQKNFLPPEFDDPLIRDSYSVYGVSYLNHHWIEYFLIGKFIFLTSPIIQNEWIAARFFNVTLFLILAIFFVFRFKSKDQDCLVFPTLLLVSPQIWYIFSYTNNDAFALFISLITAYQIAYPGSYLNKFLKAESFRQHITGGLIFGGLVGILLILKTNFYGFLIFAALWLLWRFPIFRFERFRSHIHPDFLKKFAFIWIVAFSVLTFRCALDIYVNGETNFVGLSYLNYFLGDFEQKQNRLMTFQEKFAEPPYKPSVIEADLSKTDETLKLKAKGESFGQLFTKWRWHETSFASSVGLYGYMNIYAPKFYYRLMFVLYAVFIFYLLTCIVFLNKPEGFFQTAIFLVGSLITVFISAYLSWSYALQAQGRYLFPIIPMFCLLVYANQKYLHKLVLYGFISLAFLLSAYSFLFVALARINS